MTEKKIIEDQSKPTGRKIRGRVTSCAMDKTAKVVCTWSEKHLTGKYIDRHTAYLVHDESNLCKVGDLVEARETRPKSKRKFMELVAVIESN